MTRVAISLSMLLLAVGPVRAGVPVPPPVCADPDVLDRVAQELRGRNWYARIDPRTVSEAPGRIGDEVRCGVCVRVFAYDTPRFGAAPALRCEAHGYAVRAQPNGFVLLSVD